MTEDTEHLDACAGHFLAGAVAVARTSRTGLHTRLLETPDAFCGFAYEGAAMSAHILDRLTPGHGWRVPLLLSGPGYRYRHLVHVGVGWGMARLKQPRHPRTAWGLDPLLRWLALDGFGFHDLFFAPAERRAQMLGGAIRDERDQIVRQGMGRALWFVYGADPDAIAAAVGACGLDQQDALWRGVGLAAGYAGGAKAEAVHLAALAGDHLGSLRQGLRFASTARHAHAHRTAQDFSCLVGEPAECSALAERQAIPITVRHAGPQHFRSWQASLEEKQSSLEERIESCDHLSPQ